TAAEFPLKSTAVKASTTFIFSFITDLIFYWLVSISKRVLSWRIIQGPTSKKRTTVSMTKTPT
ncbi:MAG: hypothetical protein MJK04_27735, partial [Psychrosphaera sp.]|nr:hypothetical protein [Psychrosphaera sp.]